MKPWIIGIAIVCGMLVTAWSINAVMGGAYGPNEFVSKPVVNQVAQASGGCGSGGGSGGCCASGTTNQSSAQQSPEDIASAYYIEKTGDSDFEVVVEDFGCHQVADIVKNGNVVMKLQIQGGQVTEI